METEKYRKCEFCGELIKKGNGHHFKKCVGWKSFLENNQEDIISKFLDGYSVLELSEEYDIPYSRVLTVLKLNNIEPRRLSECRNERLKAKYEKSMLEHWGTKHNFDKNCESRKQWEQRLLEEEGITNVFQRKEVIEKIKNTMHEKYTDEEIYNNYVKGGTLEYWVDKLGEVEGRKKYDEICLNKGKSMRLSYYIDLYGEKIGAEKYNNMLSKRLKQLLACGPNTSINKSFEKILLENKITYEPEFFIHRDDNKGKHFLYDFIIDKKLIVELNGDFWHANPKKYKENDILNFPGENVIAKDLWEKDKIKKELAEKHGYKVLYIWESDYKKMTEQEILKLIENEISKN